MTIGHEEERERIGRKYAAARLALGLTQSELAERAQVEQRQVSQVENGRINAKYDTLHRMALALGSTVSELTAP